MTEHHSSRRAKRLKKDADRSQKLRDKHKQSRTPTTHTLDRALSYGLMVAAAAQLSKGKPITEISLRLTLVLFEATKRLTAGTHANNRYDRAEVIRALNKRLKKLAPGWEDE